MERLDFDTKNIRYESKTIGAIEKCIVEYNPSIADNNFSNDEVLKRLEEIKADEQFTASAVEYGRRFYSAYYNEDEYIGGGLRQSSSFSKEEGSIFFRDLIWKFLKRRL